MNIPENLKYTKNHEWVRIEGDTAVIGITDHAQELLGDVVFVEVPEAGDAVTAGESFGTVESVKAVSDLFAPVSGEVLEVNEALADEPELVNSDAFEAGWMVKIKMSDATQAEALLSAEDYKALL
ncbi:glycine cleavage system protein GcvH [Myxococcota bacterium]|nr:glycine cleavage system protein GcvH [Myxococcota bacterium]